MQGIEQDMRAVQAAYRVGFFRRVFHQDGQQHAPCRTVLPQSRVGGLFPSFRKRLPVRKQAAQPFPPHERHIHGAVPRRNHSQSFSPMERAPPQKWEHLPEGRAAKPHKPIRIKRIDRQHICPIRFASRGRRQNGGMCFIPPLTPAHLPVPQFRAEAHDGLPIRLYRLCLQPSFLCLQLKFTARAHAKSGGVCLPLALCYSFVFSASEEASASALAAASASSFSSISFFSIHVRASPRI